MKNLKLITVANSIHKVGEFTDKKTDKVIKYDFHLFHGVDVENDKVYFVKLSNIGAITEDLNKGSSISLVVEPVKVRYTDVKNGKYNMGKIDIIQMNNAKLSDGESITLTK